MAMVGHKTESIYRGYSIVDQAMLDVGASKLDQRQIPPLVAELASEQATLSALQGVLTARLLASHASPTPRSGSVGAHVRSQALIPFSGDAAVGQRKRAGPGRTTTTRTGSRRRVDQGTTSRAPAHRGMIA